MLGRSNSTFKITDLMKNLSITFTFLLMLVWGCGPAGSPGSSDKEDLQDLLDQFLEGASVNDTAMHDRFWADDLIYTGSSGIRITKMDIMSDLQHESEDTGEVPPGYSSDEVQIYVFGQTAVVAFKLIAETASERMEYYNTGTFIKRDNQWKAVAWQATRITGE